MTRIQFGLCLLASFFITTHSGCCCCPGGTDTGSGGTGGTACNLSAAADAAACCPGTGAKIAANIPVLANDDLAGGSATVAINAQGALGTAVVNSGNTITYTATDRASTGQDIFTYRAIKENALLDSTRA
jgi:hypothetical protein